MSIEEQVSVISMSSMDEKDAHEVSTDAVVRQYVDEFCSLIASGPTEQ